MSTSSQHQDSEPQAVKLERLQGLRVAVAGATSYLASRLLPLLLDSGVVVAALSRPSSSARYPAIHSDRCKVLNLEQEQAGLEDDLRAFGPNVLVNCIANYGRQGEATAEIVNSNVTTPLRLIEKASSAGVKTVLSIGTALPTTLSPYAASKAQFLREAQNRYSGSLRLVNIRCEMFFGPGEASSMKLPIYVIRNLAMNVEQLEMTPGKQKRDFLHVDDVARAILAIAAFEVNETSGYSSYDIASGEPITVRAFAELAHRLSGSEARLLFGALPYRSGEPMGLNLDPTKLRALGWRPTVSLEDAILSVLHDCK